MENFSFQEYYNLIMFKDKFNVIADDIFARIESISMPATKWELLEESLWSVYALGKVWRGPGPETCT